MDATVVAKIKKLRKQGKTVREITEELAKAGVKSPRGAPYSLASVNNAASKGKVAKRKKRAPKAQEDCQECDEMALGVEILMTTLVTTQSATRTRAALQNALSMLG